MFEALTLANAFIIGLLGSSHCLAMCGGISASLCMGQQSQPSLTKLLCYNLGRVSSYALAGALFGALSWSITTPDSLIWMRSLAGFMLILMGLYVGQWYRGLTHVERLGGHIWKRLQPISKHLLPVTTPQRALLIGALWGWLPCGLVYSTLLWSFASGSPSQSALLMVFFGLGTLPALLLTGFFAQQLKQLLQKQLTHHIAGLILIGFGIATLPIATMLP